MCVITDHFSCNINSLDSNPKCINAILNIRQLLYIKLFNVNHYKTNTITEAVRDNITLGQFFTPFCEIYGCVALKILPHNFYFQY